MGYTATLEAGHLTALRKGERRRCVNARVQRARWRGQELHLMRGIASKGVTGSANLAVCLARLKSVEQRPRSWWIQSEMIQLTSWVERKA